MDGREGECLVEEFASYGGWAEDELGIVLREEDGFKRGEDGGYFFDRFLIERYFFNDFLGGYFGQLESDSDGG